MKDYILVKKDFENQNPTVEGFFHTKKKAKQYIEEVNGDFEDFFLYELKTPFDVLCK